MLSQDVDLVWRLDPRAFFSPARREAVDVYFMYDGGNPNQQPLYVNTGFYIARSNARTCRLFREAATGSEGERSQQGVVAPLLLQHYFLHGLRISVLGPRCPPRFAEISRDTDLDAHRPEVPDDIRRDGPRTAAPRHLCVLTPYE